jgi:hypothetical protein
VRLVKKFGSSRRYRWALNWRHFAAIAWPERNAEGHRGIFRFHSGSRGAECCAAE